MFVECFKYQKLAAAVENERESNLCLTNICAIWPAPVDSLVFTPLRANIQCRSLIGSAYWARHDLTRSRWKPLVMAFAA